VEVHRRRRGQIPKTVADQFAETLVAAGVKRICGIVGDSLNGLTDAIRRQRKIGLHGESRPSRRNGRADEVIDLARRNLWG
jgi:hypothetical protein